MTKSKRFIVYIKRIPSDIRRLFNEPLLLIGIILVNLFLFLFIVLPLFKIFQLSFEENGRFSVGVFYDLMSKSYNVKPLIHSLTLGVAVSILGTLIGFIFAYAIVRCQIPGSRIVHWLALVPTVSPPFALALSMILLFGRNGLITNKLLGIDNN